MIHNKLTDPCGPHPIEMLTKPKDENAISDSTCEAPQCSFLFVDPRKMDEMRVDLMDYFKNLVENNNECRMEFRMLDAVSGYSDQTVQEHL